MLKVRLRHTLQTDVSACVWSAEINLSIHIYYDYISLPFNFEGFKFMFIIVLITLKKLLLFNSSRKKIQTLIFILHRLTSIQHLF